MRTTITLGDALVKRAQERTGIDQKSCLIREALKAVIAREAATDHEVIWYVDAHRLHGTGIGYFDAYLLASTGLAPGATLWTRDKRLAKAAERLNLSAVVERI